MTVSEGCYSEVPETDLTEADILGGGSIVTLLGLEGPGRESVLLTDFTEKEDGDILVK
jgi:hypothetical protein